MFKFIQPTLWKTILTLGLFFSASLLWRLFVTAQIMDIRPVGFPFQFLVTWGPCLPGQTCSEFNPLSLGLDVVAWYLVSACLLWWKDRRRV